jgi:hypothetical protein
VASHTSRYVRCRYCGDVLHGLLPVDYAPDGALLLYHLSWHHRAQVKPLINRMRTEDIAIVAMEAFERLDDAEATARLIARMSPDALRAAIDEALTGDHGWEMPWRGHERMRTEDIGTVAMEAFERIDPPPHHEGPSRIAPAAG